MFDSLSLALKNLGLGPGPRVKFVRRELLEEYGGDEGDGNTCDALKFHHDTLAALHTTDHARNTFKDTAHYLHALTFFTYNSISIQNITLSSVLEATRIKFSMSLAATVIIACSREAV